MVASPDHPAEDDVTAVRLARVDGPRHEGPRSVEQEAALLVTALAPVDRCRIDHVVEGGDVVQHDPRVEHVLRRLLAAARTELSLATSRKARKELAKSTNSAATATSRRRQGRHR